MLFFLSSLAWAGVVVYAVRLHDQRARVALQDALTLRVGDRITDEKVAEIEANALIEVAKLGVPPKDKDRPRAKDITLPDDLEAHLNQWSDQWARDDERDAIRARYLELHNGHDDQTWQRVRRSIGLGELPE